MSTNSFVRVPPDSTGKRLQTLEHTVSGQVVNSQVMNLGDPANPENLQYVDEYGQAFMRFAEGSPGMDAFGNLRVSNAKMLGAYEYTNGPMNDLFTDIEIGGGSLTYMPTASQMVLSVDSATGSEAKRVTNRYHYYQPGVGNLVITTLALGDAGKAGNTRGWGYGDMYNGLLWRLVGTEFQVCIRSNITGSVATEAVPQSQWNGDKLDGTGVSGMVLDLTKANFYWIDFAWLGVGPARFGVLAEDGSRVVCHTFKNPNNRLGPYMATGSLPLSFHNFNTDTTAGTSEMKLICAAVYSESDINYTFWRFADIERDPVAVTTDTHILSMRPKYEVNGKVNRIGLYPDSLSVYVSDGNIKLTILDDATLSAPTWSVSGEESAEGDISASTVTGGSKFKIFYLGKGCHDLCLECFYEVNDEGYHTLANATGPEDVYTFTVVATKLDGTTVNVGAALTYRELR